MQVIRAKDYTSSKAWDAIPIAEMLGTRVRLHRADKSVRWRASVGGGVWAVLKGRVELLYFDKGIERGVLLEAGDIFYASAGAEHSARAIGEAQILAIENRRDTSGPHQTEMP